MSTLTRRGFLATTGVSTGLGVLAAAGMTENSVAHAADPGSTITSNFNGTPIAAGDFIWFSSIIDVHGLGSDLSRLASPDRCRSWRTVRYTSFPCRPRS
jgi:hypothetical protein